MSLSPNFINTHDAIVNYIIQLQQVYDSSFLEPNEINTNDDLIQRAGFFSDITDIIPIYKCPFPNSFEQGIEFIQTPISSDGNCLFSCLAYLDKWKGQNHDYVRREICNKLDTLINLLRPELFNEGQSGFQILLQMSYEDKSNQKKFETDTTNQEYIKQMKKPNAWGSGIEILTAIFITGQDINLYTMREYRDKSIASIGKLEYDFTNIKNRLITSKKIEIDKRLKQPLNIYFCGGKHYELLQPKNAMTYLKKPDILRPEKEREQIFKTAEGILKKGHTDPNIINTMHKAAALEVSSAQLEVSSAQLTKEYICIPNSKGQFPSRLDCESNTVSIKQDPTQLKTVVINEVLDQIIGKLYNDFGDDFLSDQSLIDMYERKLQQLYDKKLKLYTRYDYLDFKSFMDILKEDDFFKDKIILVETHSPPYAYKYMKYKIKYLTLKNNTHYNKYL